MAERELILASGSPRRAQILRDLGLQFRVVPSPIEEPLGFSRPMSPAELAQALSVFKAEAVAGSVRDGLILAADTVAAKDGEVFGKPSDRGDARRILQALSGTRHEVHTGMTLLDVRTGRRDTRVDTTVVVMRPLRADEIESYLESEAWIGKAGAYGIQDHGDAFVERIEGSFSNVVGLSVELLRAMLKAFDGVGTGDD
ncbi:MAG: Septum formation protein Maf [Phycisphaerae bacterium]|nr:Septum formation protein Maf [Phycisphaerae bacterium]